MDEKVIEKLENTWSHISAHESSDDKYVRECFEATRLNPLSKICGLIQQGLIPSPENFKALADCVETYLQAKGRVSLEEVLFNTPKDKPGLFAEMSHHESIDLIMDLKKQAGDTYISTAENLVAQLGLNIDPESLKKSYDRRKKSKT